VGETGGFVPQLLTKGGVETKCQEGHEDMAFDAILVMVEARGHCAISFEILEGFFDLCKQHVQVPDLARVLCAEVGARR